MSVLWAIALTTGLLSGIWGWMSFSLGLLTWAGFLGCTSYFAISSSIDGIKGLLISLSTNLSGVFWGMMIILLSSLGDQAILGYLATGIVATLMCVQSSRAWLSYIPGTFIGCCATFAATGDWMAVIPALILGAIFGYLMKTIGLWLYRKTNHEATLN